MKLLFTTGIFYPASVGGPSVTIYNQVKFLSLKGYDIKVVSTTSQLPVEANIKANKWINYSFGSAYYAKNLLWSFLQLLKSIPQQDCIHYNSVCSKTTIFTILYSMLLRKKVVLSPRGEMYQSAINNSRFKYLIFKTIYRWVNKKVLWHATCKEEQQTILAFFSKAKVIVQPNFIDVKPIAEPVNVKRDLVYLGRVAPIKCLDKLIDGLSKSTAYMQSDEKLIIIGEPLLERDFVYKDTLISLIKKHNLGNRVVFVGNKFGEVKKEYLRGARCLMLTSASENFGNVVVEAMSQGTPCLTSKGTPWAVLEQENCGFWIENEPQIIGSTIDTLYQMSADKYVELAKNALRLYIRDYYIHTSKLNRWCEILK